MDRLNTLQDVRDVIESAGRILRPERMQPLSREDLNAVRDALNTAAEILQTIRDTQFV